MKSLFSIGLMLLALNVQAQTLKSATFEDQWDSAIVLDKQVDWLVISQSKDAGNWVKESLQGLKVSDLEAYKLLYIADISAMPSLVTKFFALPKMQEYDFKMALIKEDDQLAQMQLPLKDKESVAVIKLDDLKVGEAQYFSDTVSLQAFLQEMVIK